MSDEDEFIECVKRLEAKHPTLRLDLDWSTAIAILAHLQLALRHPGTRGKSTGMVREFVDALITNVSRVEPKLARLLRKGDDQQHDVARGYTDSTGKPIRVGNRVRFRGGEYTIIGFRPRAGRNACVAAIDLDRPTATGELPDEVSVDLIE